MRQQKRNVTRMISLILAEKIFSLFLIMFMGYAVVHWGLLHAEDSKTLSLISLYLISPCVIISAFQIQYTPDVLHGLLLALAAALCLDAIICNILLKPMVCRIRPCDVNQTVQLIIARPADYSFPSGHTAASFAAVAALYFAGAKKWWKITLPLAILMAFSRMYLYVHYPTDVLGGMIVGCAAGYFGNRLAAHLIRSWRQKMKKPEDRKNR